MPISDVTGGFRCMRSSVLSDIHYEQIQANGYAFQMELNYRLVKSGARIQEIPFFFLDRTRGTSKLSFRIGFETLWLAWWLRINGLLGRI